MEGFLDTMALVLLVLIIQISVISAEEQVERYRIEGKVTIHGTKNSDWVSETKVLVDGGIFIGFLRPDGGFTIKDVPAGSYIVEAVSPNYMFEPVRVDISGRAKGKSRARKVNFLQNSAVVQVAYPLKFKAKVAAPFFEKREKWNIKDMLMNPMIIMMVLPLLLLLVLPKLISTADPETQKEMQSSMNMFNQSKDLPDISDWFAKNLSGFTKRKPSSKTPAKKAITGGRRR